MVDGCEREATSRQLFELIYGVEVKQVGIVFKNEFRHYHASPDGLISDNAILELKNPLLKTQCRYLLDGSLPSDYFGQCQMSLHTCDRDLLYFMSCYIGLPPFIVELRRDEVFIYKMAKALEEFVAELHETVAKLRALQ